MKAIYLCLVGGALATKENPVGKVVQLLTNLKAEVEAECKGELESCAKYAEWAANTMDASQDSYEQLADKIEDSQAAVANYAAQAEAAGTKVTELSQQISQNEGDLAAATAVRKQENADFKAAEAELLDAIDTLHRAKNILKNSMRTGFTQKVKSQLLQMVGGIESVIESEAVATDDAKKLAALIQGTDAEDNSEDDESLVQQPQATVKAYESRSGGIVNTIQELIEKAKHQLTQLRKAEAQSAHAYNMLVQNLNFSNKTFQKDLGETKNEKAANEEGLGAAKGALAEQQAGYADDVKVYESVKAEAAQKAGECDQRQKDGREEIAVIEKAIEILTGGEFQDSHNRVKLIQTASHDKDVRDEIANVIANAAKKYHSVALGQLATRTRVGADPFGKVRGLISQMIERLEKQAAEEADENTWCNEETAKTTAKRDDKSAKVDKYAARAEKSTAAISLLKQDIASLSKEISDANASFNEATTLRQQEASEYAALMKDLAVVQKNLEDAIETLNAYYAQESVSDAKKTDAATSIISILQTAEADFAEQEAQAQAQENAAGNAFKNYKQAYEVDMAAMTQSVKTKESEAASVAAALEDTKSDLSLSQSELDATVDYLEKVRKRCTHKPMTFAERQAKRQNEIKSLEEALRILDEETAGDAFMQVRAVRHY